MRTMYDIPALAKKQIEKILSAGLDDTTTNKKENNMRYQPKRENILFLTPSIENARTVVKNLAYFFDRNEIPYNVSPEHTAPYVVTDFANIDFMWCDPIDWKASNFKNVDAVFGKKELVEKAKELFGCQCLIKTPNRCLDDYLINIVRKTTECDNPDRPASYIPAIKKVHFNDPVTVVLWEDGTKTVVKCQDGDKFSKETGLALCISKKAFGNKGNFNDIFKQWIPEEEEPAVGVPIDKSACATARITDGFDSFRDEIIDDIADVLFNALKKTRRD